MFDSSLPVVNKMLKTTAVGQMRLKSPTYSKKMSGEPADTSFILAT